jgi:dephospho-CoA kinase
MLNVALTGNIAAGKSTVVDLFRRWGATIIDADQLVREAQRPGTEVMQAIAFRFGRDVILPGGELDRTALRGKVMGDDASLADLNAIVHPAVRRERDRLLAEARKRGDRIVVNDIPLLFEAADPAEFDLVVLVDAPEEARRERLVRLRGMTPEAADQALRAQEPTETKRARSDFIIENGGSLADLERSAQRVWKALEARAIGDPATP